MVYSPISVVADQRRMGQMKTSSLPEMARVKFEYEPQHSDELRLAEVGQLITIIRKDCGDAGWFEGEINGRRGLFPDNFVELVQVGHYCCADEAFSSVSTKRLFLGPGFYPVRHHLPSSISPVENCSENTYGESSRVATSSCSCEAFEAEIIGQLYLYQRRWCFTSCVHNSLLIGSCAAVAG